MFQMAVKLPYDPVGRISKSKWIPFNDFRSDLIAEANCLIQSVLDESIAYEQPQLVHLCGIPGSGKSTYAELFRRENPSFNIVQFDAVMEKLEGYRKDKVEKGIVEAFHEWELPARAIGYHLFQALMEAKRNVLFDHSASSADHLTIIDIARAQGFTVEMHCLNCPPTEAFRRVKAREPIIQRHTPENLIWEREKILADLIRRYKEKVNRFMEVNPDYSRNATP